MCAGVFQRAIGHSISFFEPGTSAARCDDAGTRRLNAVVEKEDPSVIFIHAPLENGIANSTGYDNLKNFAQAQERAGRTCIMADARHTSRWDMCKPSVCRGDLEFQCSDPNITSNCWNGTMAMAMAIRVALKTWKTRDSPTSSEEYSRSAPP